MDRKSRKEIRDIYNEIPTKSQSISTLEKKILKQKLKKLKNENCIRRRGRGKQKIHETPLSVPEKVEKIKG